MVTETLVPDWIKYFCNKENIKEYFHGSRYKGLGWYNTICMRPSECCSNTSLTGHSTLLIVEIPEITEGKLKGSKYQMFCWNGSTKNQIIKSHADAISTFLSYEDKG